MSTRKHKETGSREPKAGSRPPEAQGPAPKAGSRPPEAQGPAPKAGSRKAEAVLVADRLHSAAIHLLRRLRKQDVATGEGPARLSALSVLVFAGPKTLKELAAAEQVKPPTMSRIVAGLARSHLIHIEQDPDDARRMRIHATPKGAQILHKGRDLRIAYLAQHLERLTALELSHVGNAVEILARLLKDWD